MITLWIALLPACRHSATLCAGSTPQLDPLFAALDPDPEASAKLRAFYSAARGLRDAAEDAERIARLACTNIDTDLANGGLGGPRHEATAATDAALACASAARRVRSVFGAAGKPLSWQWQPPRCVPDDLRRGHCEALCNHSPGMAVDAYCSTTCQSLASLHARCTSVEIALTSNGPASQWSRDLLLLHATLQRNLPWVVHASEGLVLRLRQDVETLAKTGTELPELLRNAGPRGLTCLTAAVELVNEARIDFTLVGKATRTLTTTLPTASGQGLARPALPQGAQP